MPRRLALLLCAVVTASALTLAQPARAATVAPNSGLPGSTCQAGPSYLPYARPGNGVATVGLGSDAPAYYEIGSPTGAFLGQKPKGIMVIVHGGSWFAVGKELVADVRWYADHVRAMGWQTVSVDYRACAKSIGDVAWFTQRVRVLNATSPICTTGMSAGAHLALLVASVRNDIGCAVGIGGPTDLVGLANQRGYDPNTNTYTYNPSRLVNRARAAFGSTNEALALVSPMTYAATFKPRLLLANGLRDLVPLHQTWFYAAAIKAAQPAAYVDIDFMEYGNLPWVHTTISPAALDAFYRSLDALVAPLVA